MYWQKKKKNSLSLSLSVSLTMKTETPSVFSVWMQIKNWSRDLTLTSIEAAVLKNNYKPLGIYYIGYRHRPAVSSVAKRMLSVREVLGSIPGPVKSTQGRQRLATVATFLRSCVIQALSRGDGPRNSLHASA